MEYVSLDVEYQEHGVPTQVAIIDSRKNVLFNEYFKVPPNIPISAKKKRLIESKEPKSYPDFKPVIVEILQNKVIVGHDLVHDFKALGLNINKFNILDTSRIEYYMRLQYASRTLKNIAKEYLNRNIQLHASHNALEDADAAMDLVLLYNALQSSQTKSETQPIPNIADLIEFPNTSSSNYAKNMAGLSWNSLPALPEQSLNEFLKRSTISSTFNNNLLQFPKSHIPNYARNMEGLQFDTTSDNDTALLSFDSPKTASNYSKNMEGLQFNTVIPYKHNSTPLLHNNALLTFNAPSIKSKTAANYAKNMEGLRFNNYTKKNTGKSKFKQSMNKMRKVLTRTKKY
jgi:hypothetical protein